MTPPATTTTSYCTDCKVPLGRRSWLKKSLFCFMTDPNNHPCENPNKDCPSRLCTACHGKRPLMMMAADATTSAAAAAAAAVEDDDDLSSASIKCMCQSCFEELSTVDYSKKYDVIQGSSDVVFVFVHGASGTRRMFYYHAVELKEKFGHSSILLDLPGHGSLVEKKLTLASACETVETVIKECSSVVSSANINNNSNKKLIYVGASLGGYIGFHILKELHGMFAGAVLMDCGQNVGPGASVKARLGLVVLNYIGRKMTNTKLMKLMYGEMQKSRTKDWYHVLPSTFGAGMFFDQAGAHVDCLRQVAPAELLPSINNVPILFMNGSEDYRDSEDKWLSLSHQDDDDDDNNKCSSELKVYQGGDHFFTHDARFVPDMLARMDAFSKKL